MTGAPSAPDPQLQHLLAVWMPRQRWFPAKGRGVGLRHLGGTVLDDPRHEAEVEVRVVGLDSGDRLDVVQVPLTFRATPLPSAERALVGVLGTGTDDRRWVYDGTHDPAYVSALLRALEVAPGARMPTPDAPARVLAGEQSNTSIVVDPDGHDATIVKVFRTLQPGANPDVEVTAALAARGCDRVPSVHGWLSGTWRGADGRPADGHLAVAVEFLAGSTDAWVEAVSAAAADTSFDAQARDVGVATAAVHVALAEAFGHTEMSRDERARLLAALRGRVQWALVSAPALQPYAAALLHHSETLGELTEAARLPHLQRIHGDLHLGQVLHSPRRGWVLLDFEGEPLRPLAERRAPDLPLRDVAGMLRSFDYAARFASADVGGTTDDDPEASDRADRWALRARDAFCAGYASAGGSPPEQHADLLAALELDKALYEVVYETRNRPRWLDVPLQAVERVLGD